MGGSSRDIGDGDRNDGPASVSEQNKGRISNLHLLISNMTSHTI